MSLTVHLSFILSTVHRCKKHLTSMKTCTNYIHVNHLRWDTFPYPNRHHVFSPHVLEDSFKTQCYLQRSNDEIKNPCKSFKLLGVLTFDESVGSFDRACAIKPDEGMMKE